jgi:Family of unknown function (DUF6481)
LQEQDGRGHGPALCHIFVRVHVISGLEKWRFWHSFRTDFEPGRVQGIRMRGFKEKGFNDRLQDQAKARQALLERAKAANPANDPDFARRQAERKRIADEREAREQARAEAREAELRAEAERKAAEEAARLEAERLAAEETERKKREEGDKLVQLLADQKAARDARYAARKARLKGKR